MLNRLVLPAFKLCLLTYLAWKQTLCTWVQTLLYLEAANLQPPAGVTFYVFLLLSLVRSTWSDDWISNKNICRAGNINCLSHWLDSHYVISSNVLPAAFLVIWLSVLDETYSKFGTKISSFWLIIVLLKGSTALQILSFRNIFYSYPLIVQIPPNIHSDTH